MEFRLKALTPVWTGGVGKKDNKLHLTGIKGSIRWWYEVLIRGLEYYACDPTDDSSKYKRCELDAKKLNKSQLLLPEIKKKICPACYMFGCTGWSGKLNLRIKNSDGNIRTEQLKEKTPFIFEVVERKKFEEKELLLLTMTLKLIVDYGAIGGRTIFKPSEKSAKNKDLHHQNFGIIERGENSGLPTENVRIESIDVYLKNFEKNDSDNNSDWPDLKNFWFVRGKYFDRKILNQLVNRNIGNGKYNNSAFSNDIFLGGFTPVDNNGVDDSVKDAITARKNATGRDTESKKIFSFHGQSAGSKRCFGYSKKHELKEIIKLVIEHIKGDYSSLNKKIMCGTEVLDEL